MASVTTVTFDLWQTLLLDEPGRGDARAQARMHGAAQALWERGEKCSIQQIQEAYHATYRHCMRTRLEHMDVSFREQVEVFVNYISAGLATRLDEGTFQRICDIYSDAFFVAPPGPHPEAVRVLQELRDMGLRLGVVSNTGMTPGTVFCQLLAQHRMLDYFDALTFSDQVKLAKPSHEIFLMTLETLGASPGETVHVGDDWRTDVVGAKRAGLRVVWIEGFTTQEDSDPELKPAATISDLSQIVPVIRRLGR